MHPQQYKALEEASVECVATGNDCLRHCLGMYAMTDTSMAGCADAAYQVVAACGALQALAAVNSPHVAAIAKGVEQICKACQKDARSGPRLPNAKPAAIHARPAPRNAAKPPSIRSRRRAARAVRRPPCKRSRWRYARRVAS